ncbi:transglycosylase SLT domain-containing protein [Spongiibacter tropicus]|uniref:transglycosylase SLT domain-containing protein n=1 Tax=Spongiibacter tropicus TaxID=454602 RepID=UPI0003B76CC0|nr:transglycosylase SLT domain-containing protein [Spongiibacter tropicus]
MSFTKPARGLSAVLVCFLGFHYSATAQDAFGDDAFSDFAGSLSAEFAEFEQSQADEWNSFVNEIRAEQDAFIAELESMWGSETESSDRSKWVEYARDRRVKRTVDFENNQIRIAVMGQPSPDEMNRIISEQLQGALETTTEQANQEYPIVARMQETATSKPLPPVPVVAELRELVGEKDNRKAAAALASKAKISEVEIKPAPQKKAAKPAASKPVVASNSSKPASTAKAANTTPTKAKATVAVIDLSDSWPVRRARKYSGSVTQFADKMDIPRPLAYAIMYTESSFNPVAVSPIPAYGLMQIVPGSAGRDVTKMHFGKEQLLSPEYLFTADKNIEVGIGYLNILDKRYLRKIKDPLSRKYCTIAAYNTGAGNVAKAFTGKLNISRAAVVINNMSPQDVFITLETKLPYDETRKYIKKVTAAEKHFLSL